MLKHLAGLKQGYKTTCGILKRDNTPCTMSGMNLNMPGIPVPQVVATLQKFADLSLADSWDNVGLLVEPTETKLVSHILLTNDLTEDVMQEALDLKTDMIITYHPLIFAPLKSVTTRSWKVTGNLLLSYPLDSQLQCLMLIELVSFIGENCGQMFGEQNSRVLSAYHVRFSDGWCKRLVGFVI